MDKAFFDSLEQRKSDFTSRLEDPENIGIEMVLSTGRAYLLEKVIEAGDAWVQVDGRDAADEENPLSVTVPYHQIGQVRFVRRKTKSRSAGFSR